MTTHGNQADISREIEDGLRKLHLEDVDWARALSPGEILYLLDRCPFLQMVSTGDEKPLAEPEFVVARSGWTIHQYGDALSSSPGELLFGLVGDYRLLLERDDSDDGDGGLEGLGRGTIVKQAFDTAAEMIQLAKQLGWRGVKIIDGHPLMQWAAWMQAMDDGVALEGYEPSEKDRQKRERIKRSDVEDQLAARREQAKRPR